MLRGRGEMNVEAFGLIDRDGRDQSDIAKLTSKGVATLEWAEIENLLLHEEVLKHVANALHRDANQDVSEVKNRVINHLARDAEQIACELAGREIDRNLRAWPWTHRDGAAMEKSLTEHLDRIDGAAAIATWRARIQEIVVAKDYQNALKVYPNKGLLSDASLALGLRDYEDHVLRCIASSEGAPLIALMKPIVPALPA